jgi:hypothetical protein
MKIRNYKQEDFEMLQSWWKMQDEFPPTRDMLPEESTYIVEYAGNAVSAITLYLTNTKEFCILDNFIANPLFSGDRRGASKMIIEYAEQQAKILGYKSIMCMALKDKLKDYYQTFGYVKRFDNLATFNKEL